MDKRIFYFILASIITFALILAVLIFPGLKTLNLMRYFNKEYETSFQNYETLYRKGDRSLTVLNPLIELNLDYANPQEAIRLLEEFEKAHPDRKDILEVLGQLYLGADRPHSYLQTLEKLYTISPSKTILRTLIGQFQYFGDTAKWLKYLKIITSEYKADPFEYEMLAYYYASQGKFEEAVKEADTALALCQNLKECGSISSLKVSILLTQGQPEEAIAFAKSLMERKYGDLLIPDIVYLFINRNMPREAFQILETAPKSIQHRPDIVDATIAVLYALGNTDTIYTYLKSLSLSKELPEGQINNLISLGLSEERNPKALQEMLLQQNFSKLNDNSWLSLIQLAYKERLLPLYEKLQQTISKESLVLNPILHYALEMSLPNPPTPHDLGFYLRPDLLLLTDEESVQLAIIYHNLGFKTMAKEELQNLPSFEAVPYNLLSTISFLYIDLDIAEDGYKKIQAYLNRLKEPPVPLEIAWLILSTATGREAQVAKWLAVQQQTLLEGDIRQIYEAASLSKHPKTALYTAELLLARNPSVNYQVLYANALVMDGQVAKGVELLTSLYKANPNSLEIELSLLNAFAKNVKENPGLRPELNSLIDKILVHEEITLTQERNAGYALFEGGLNAESARFFLKLAQSSPQSNEDMQMLLYLWGNKINDDQANWIAAQASLAEGKTKGEMIQLLASAGYADLAYSLVKESELEVPEIFDGYLLAAAALHKEEEVKQLLTRALNKSSDLKRLKDLASIATGNSLYDAGEMIYLKILELSPLDKEALREIGNLYFNQAAYSYAQWYLGLYLSLYEPDALSLFHFAEIYHRDGDDFHARGFYYGALSFLPEMIKKNEETETGEELTTNIGAISYYRLNYPFTAIRIYEDALEKKGSSNIALNSGLANLLIDLDCMGYAAEFLFNRTYKSEDKDELLFIENLRTTWFRKTNQILSAYAHSDYVLTAYNNKGYAWSSRGELEYNVGYWRQALNDYCTASKLEPKNEDFQRSIKDIVDQHRSFTGLFWQWRKIRGVQTEHISGLTEAFNPTLYSRVLFLAELDKFRVYSYTNSVTGLTDSAFGNRSRYSLSWTYDFFDGDQTIYELFAAPRVVGGGFHYLRPDLYGKTTGGIELRRPNWDFPETIVEFGSRDRIYIERFQRLWERVDGLLHLEGRRYHVIHSGGAAGESIAWIADLSYTLPEYHWMTRLLGNESSVVINYNIDAEYGTWVKEKTNAEGVQFAPLAIGQREIHTIEMTVNKTEYRYLNLHAHFGFAYDRFGGINKASAVYGASANWIKRPGLNWDVLYDHSPSTSLTGQNEDRFIIGMSYYY